MSSTTDDLNNNVIFEPLEFKNLTVKNRIFRSSITGRWDDYHGSGTQARLNWEEQFARGGVGAIISSYVPISIRGRITPSVATIHDDRHIPFWRRVGEEIHRYDCKFILQLSHSGRQRDLEGVENMIPDRYQPEPALSSTNRSEQVHGFPCRQMTYDEVQQTVEDFANGALRAQKAGLDGVETHSAHGYLITQFLSSGINDYHRSSDPKLRQYGGSLENRYRFLKEVILAIRSKVGHDFHVQAKISVEDFNNVMPWEPKGDGPDEAIQICQWLERDGVDGIHVSVGSTFPHPLNPVGGFAFDVIRSTYDSMVSSSRRGTFFNYFLFRYRFLQPIFSKIWNWRRFKNNWQQPIQGDRLSPSTFDPLFIEHIPLEEMQTLLTDYQGINLEYARMVKQKVRIPVICTGAFQQASYIRQAIEQEFCDGVTIARPLIANPNLVNDYFAKGKDLADKPCTYCNKCVLNYVENPLGCYDIRRFYTASVKGLDPAGRNDGDRAAYQAMIEKVMSVFNPQFLP